MRLWNLVLVVLSCLLLVSGSQQTLRAQSEASPTEASQQEEPAESQEKTAETPEEQQSQESTTEEPAEEEAGDEGKPASESQQADEKATPAEEAATAEKEDEAAEKKSEPEEGDEDADAKESKEASAEDAAEEQSDEGEAEDSASNNDASEEEEGDAESTDMEGKILVRGLNNPCGVAVQPETGVIFVADSGNHQVVKIVDGEAKPVITDFPADVYGKGPKVNIGPLGLLFLDKTTLVVGGGGLPDGEEMLRIYELPDGDEPIKANAMQDSFTLAATDEIKGEGNFYALAATPAGVFVTCNGDDTKGWVSRLSMADEEKGPYERYLATKEATGVDAPVGITVSPEGYLVIGQMGEINIPNDSLITFYDANSKEMLLNLESGLHDIAAIAYSPRGQMYVLDYAWMDTTQGGLFQVLADEDSETGMRTKKIASLDKPTAMAFDADGSLYITVIGEAEDGDSKGQLIQIPPGL